MIFFASPRYFFKSALVWKGNFGWKGKFGMREIKCPKCGEVFQVDESGYAAI